MRFTLGLVSVEGVRWCEGGTVIGEVYNGCAGVQELGVVKGEL